MKNIYNKTHLVHLLILIAFLFCSSRANAQDINSKKGYDTQIGVMVYMLENLKSDVISSTRGLNQSETDYQFDEQANSIGAIVLHLAAVEVGYQKSSFRENILNEYEKEEQDILEMSLDLDKTKEILKEKPIKYYLDIYKKVRKNTLKEFKNRNDDWWTKDNHWSWFHVMEHQAHHLGQIKLILQRLP
ncbi:DUF664 domain-containing protein [Cellulophaga sp. 20_2_10]|uniref:DinB family protein n=1 Tax=Cellulophaga sp. 20_2_10 TaxID=2942476 RepID=UPI00201B0809|nr:DUF664 domain-containing protein [Cellulophaga sp. 20_2_10]MCL5246924.1 DUF664 domain-containing protein [Cellulophaga sp. 20_2_10]